MPQQEEKNSGLLSWVKKKISEIPNITTTKVGGRAKEKVSEIPNISETKTAKVITDTPSPVKERDNTAELRIKSLMKEAKDLISRPKQIVTDIKNIVTDPNKTIAGKIIKIKQQAPKIVMDAGFGAIGDVMSAGFGVIGDVISAGFDLTKTKNILKQEAKQEAIKASTIGMKNSEINDKVVSTEIDIAKKNKDLTLLNSELTSQTEYLTEYEKNYGQIQDFANLKKKLESTKNTIKEKQLEITKAIELHDSLITSKDVKGLGEPFSSDYFTDRNKLINFNKNTIDKYVIETPLNSGDKEKNNFLFRTQQSFLKRFYQPALDGYKSGIYETPDDFFNEPQVINQLDAYLSSMKIFLDENMTNPKYNPRGKDGLMHLDMKSLQNDAMADVNVKNAWDTAGKLGEDTKKNLDEEYRDKTIDAEKTTVGQGYTRLLKQHSDLNSYIRSKPYFELEGKGGIRGGLKVAGGTSAGSLEAANEFERRKRFPSEHVIFEDTFDDNGFLDKVQQVFMDQPETLVVTALSLPLLAAKWGTAAKMGQIINNSTRTAAMWSKIGNMTKTLVLDNAISLTTIDSAIDSATKSPMLMANIAFNSIGSLFSKTPSSITDNILYEVYKTADPEKQLSIIEKIAPGLVVTKEELADGTKLRGKLDFIINSTNETKAAAQNIAMAKDAVDGLDNIDDVEKAMNLLEQGGSEGSFSKMLGGSIDELKKKIAEYRVTPGQAGLATIKDTLKKMYDSVSPETINNLAKTKLITNLNLKVYDDIYKLALEKTAGDKSKASSIALEFVMGQKKTAGTAGALSSLGTDGEKILEELKNSEQGKLFDVVRRILTDNDYSSGLKKIQKIHNDMEKTITGMTEKMRNGFDRINELKSAGTLDITNNIDNVVSTMLPGSAKSYANMQGILGNIFDALNVGAIDEFNKGIYSLGDEIYNNLSKGIKAKVDATIGKKGFTEKIFEYINGDAVSKYGILRDLVTNKMEGVAVIYKNLDEAISKVFFISASPYSDEASANLLSLAATNVSGEKITNKVILSRLGATDVKQLDEFTKTLIRGVGGKSQEVYLPSVVEISQGLKKAAKKGEPIYLDLNYNTPKGRAILNAIFLGDKKVTPEFIDECIRKTIVQNNELETMMTKFFDKNTGALSTEGKVFKKGPSLSLRDILRQVSHKLTGGKMATRINGGIIETPMIKLTKYILSSEATPEFLNFYMKEVINGFFDGGVKRGDAYLENIINLVDNSMGSKGVNIGDAYLELYNRVNKRLEPAFLGSKVDIVKTVHPMLFNPQEYLYGIGKAQTLDEAVDIITKTIINRNIEYYLFGKGNRDIGEGLSQIRRSISQTTPDINYIKGGAAIRNENVNKLESFLRDTLEKNEGALKLEPSFFAEYKYDLFGNSNAGKVDIVGDDISDKFFNQIEFAIDNSEEFMKIEDNLLEVSSEIIGKREAIIEDIETKWADIQSFNTKTGKIADLESKINELKQTLKDVDLLTPEIESSVDSLYDAVKEAKENIISNSIAGKVEGLRTKTTLAEPEITTAEELDDIVKTSEKLNATMDRLNSLPETESALRIRKEIFNLQNFKSGGFELNTVFDALRLTKKEKTMYMQELGFADEDIKQFVNKGYFSNPNDSIYTALSNLSVRGHISFMDALSVNSFKKNIVNQIDIAAEGKKGEYLSYDRYGNLEMRDNFELGDVMKKFISLNVQATKDPELQGMLQRMSGISSRTVRNRHFNVGNMLKFKDVSFSKYLKLSRIELQKLILESGVDAEHFVGLVRKAIFDAGMTKKEGQITKMASKTEKISDKILNVSVSNKDLPLLDALTDFFSDVRGIQGYDFNIPDDILNSMLIDIKAFSTTKSNRAANMANRITGQLMLFDNQDIPRFIAKYGPNNGAAGNYIKNILLGGLFDKSIKKNILNKLTGLSMQIMFGAQNLYKFPQQFLNNMLHADAKIKSLGIDFAKYDSLVEWVNKRSQIDLFEGGLRDIVTGESKGLLNSFIKWNSVLLRADAASKAKALRGSMVDALYDVYSKSGQEGVEKLIKEFDEFEGFMSKYDLVGSDLYDRTTAVEKFMKNGGSIEEIDKLDEMAMFLKSTINPLKTKFRTSVAVFYGMDNIPELSYMPFLDNNKWAFALKKRSYSKFSEYGYKLASDYRRLGGKAFVKEILDGNNMLINQIGTEFATMARVGRGLDRATGGEFDRKDFVLAMTVPATVLYMTMGSAMESAWKTAANYEAARDENEEVSDTQKRVETAGVGLVGILQGLVSTAFIYHTPVINAFAQSFATASEGNPDSKNDNYIVNFGKALFSQIIIKALNGKMKSNVWGDYVNSAEYGTFYDNLLETTFNMQAEPRKQLQNSISKMYSSLNAKDGGFVSQLKSWLNAALPIGVKTTTTSAQMGIVKDRYEKYFDENGMYVVYNEFADTNDKEGVNKFIDNYEAVNIVSKLLGDENVLGKLGKTKQDLQNMSADELQKFVIDNGLLTTEDDLYAFSDILKGYRGELNKVKDIKGAVTAYEDSPELTAAATKFFDEKFGLYAKKGKQRTDKMITDFIDYSSQLGGNYTMGEYLNSYNKGIKEVLKKQYGLSKMTYKPGEKTAPVAEKENYKAYLNELHTLQTEAIHSIRGNMGKNKAIGTALLLNYIDKDKLNRPTKKFSTKMVITLDNLLFSKNLKEEGYLGYNQMSISSMYARLISSYLPKDNKPGTIAQYKRLGQVVGDRLQSIDTMSQGPATKALMKIRMTNDIFPLIQELKDKAPEELAKIKIGLGSSFDRTLDILLDSEPADLISAFEAASGIDTTPGGSSKKFPKAKIEEAKRNGIRLANAYNSTIALASKLKSQNISPVKYKVNIEKLKMGVVELDEIKIDVPKMKIEVPVISTGATSAKTKQLQIKTTSTKLGGMTSRYKPKAIKKVASSKKKARR